MRPTDDVFKAVNEKLNVTASEGLRHRLVTDALDAREESRRTGRASVWLNIRRITMRNHIGKLATAALIAAGMFIGISYLFTGQRAAIALGDVIKEMQQAATVMWTETSEVAPPKDKNTFLATGGYVRRCFYKAPGHTRLESTYLPPKDLPPLTRSKELTETLTKEYRDIQIIDRNVGKHLLLNPQAMTGETHSFDPARWPDRTLDLFFSPTSTMAPEAESLGSRQIEGHETVGFRILKKGDGTDIWSGDKTEIWVDLKTKRVVLLETGAADGGWRFVLKDFVFDEPLDDSLFTLELPQGYKEKPPGPVYSTTP